MEERIEQFKITAATLLVLELDRDLVTSFSNSGTQAGTASVDGLDGHLPNSSKP
jgi:hypothetical protein